MNFRYFRLILWVVIAVVSCWILIGKFITNTPGETTLSAAGVGLQVSEPYLSLTASSGAAFDTASFKGEHQLIYFGFTFCPDVCPISARKMLTADVLYQQLSADVPLHSVFITIDPQRDTPDIMGIFAENLVDDVISDWPVDEQASITLDLTALSGTQAQIDAATLAYRVYAEKVVEGEGGAGDAYRFNHTDMIYWVKPSGEVQYFSARQSAQDIAAALKAAS